jgi:hypothetical protein
MGGRRNRKNPAVSEPVKPTQTKSNTSNQKVDVSPLKNINV